MDDVGGRAKVLAQIAALRDDIDAIDQQLVHLLSRRARKRCCATCAA
jgi:chorismate mutase